MEDAVPLSDVIWQLRHELSRAMWAGENADLRFQAEAVELELTVGVERARDPNAKVSLWVLEAGASAHRTSTATQRLKLTLRPVQGNALDRPATIAGRPFEGEE
jgi:hypothetical protein